MRSPGIFSWVGELIGLTITIGISREIAAGLHDLITSPESLTLTLTKPRRVERVTSEAIQNHCCEPRATPRALAIPVEARSARPVSLKGHPRKSRREPPRASAMAVKQM